MTLLDLMESVRGPRATCTVVGEETVAWERLHEQARALGGGLVAAGAEPGRPVAFAAGTSLGTIRTLLATWHLGSPVMVLPLPHRTADPEAVVAGWREAVERVGAPLIVCDDTWRDALPDAVHHADLRPGPCTPRRPQPADVAVFQPTSGTTARPRIVAITHANLVAYVKAFRERTAADAADDGVMAWVPLAFDAGLSCVWVSAATGMPLAMAATEEFVAAPGRWAAWLAEHGSTITVAPNFAFGVAARVGLGGHDLSRLRVAINGGETINPRTFAAFAAAGAPAASLACTYGLAEATAACSMAVGGMRTHTDEHGREHALLGEPMPGLTISVAEDGEILIEGPTVASGYVGEPPVAGPLRTGDVGYLVDGQLVVSGRRKELIVVAGRNVSPEEVEWAAARAGGVRPGNVIAFAAAAGADRERVVVVAECRDGDPARVRDDVVRVVREEAGLRLDDVVLIAPGALPKTPSGKLQRGVCRERYLAGALH